MRNQSTQLEIGTCRKKSFSYFEFTIAVFITLHCVFVRVFGDNYVYIKRLEWRVYLKYSSHILS